ncbi:uncharacterized protein [Montipora capricornis]|uniref:uncharacterized protein isoform X2 n=1 Tax=Montipora capricornis TaxID=246305 RepID=UPI0035F1EA9D
MGNGIYHEFKHALIISHRGSPELCWNMALLTGLSLMWFFFAESRSDYVLAKITRQDYIDRFTNDVSHCGNCSKYNASENSPGICTCNRLPCETQRKKIGGSVFIRSQGRCMSSCDLLQNIRDSCFHWQNSLPSNAVPLIVIDVNKVNSTYNFIKNLMYDSCEWRQHIEYLDARGHWESANVSAETFKVLRIPDWRHRWQTMIKVNKRSAVLASLGGHVMKLGLTCKRKDNTPIEKCLVFKSKGELNFTLCNYTATPSPSSTVERPCTIVTPSIQTTTPTPTTTVEVSTTVEPPDVDGPDPIMIALLALLVVCLIIGAPVICFCFYTRGRNWNLHPREGGNFADNSAPQTYRIQEEPYYVELPDIEPSNMRSPGMATLITTEQKQPAEDTVILNPYVRGASYTRARSLMPEPLPLRPIHEENAVMEEVAGDVTPKDEQNGQDTSVVLRNPQVRGTLDRSSPLSRRNHEDLPKERGEEEKDEVKPELGHHSRKTDDGNEHNLDYQRLVDGTRTQSLFICPCCDKDLDYQTLLDHCSLERKEQQSQKRESFYESLSPEKGKRESIYAIPLRSGESFSENEGTDNMEQWPEYQTLEPNETDSNREPIEPANHEYNELEGPEHNELEGPEHNELEGPEHNELKGPEQTCCEVDVDNKKLWQVHLGDSDSEIPREIIEILHVDINPAYALPWKKKAKEKSMRKRSLSV